MKSIIFLIFCIIHSKSFTNHKQVFHLKFYDSNNPNPNLMKFKVVLRWIRQESKLHLISKKETKLLTRSNMLKKLEIGTITPCPKGVCEPLLLINQISSVFELLLDF